MPFTAPTLVEGGYPLEFFEGSEGFDKLAETYRLGAEEALRRNETDMLAYLHLRRDPFTSALGDGLYVMRALDTDMPAKVLREVFLSAIRLYGGLGETRGSVLIMSIDSEVTLKHKVDGTLRTLEATVTMLHVCTPLAERSYAAKARYCLTHGIHLDELTLVDNPKAPGLLAPMDPRQVSHVLQKMQRHGAL
jgi:hypothetical protein